MRRGILRQMFFIILTLSLISGCRNELEPTVGPTITAAPVENTAESNVNPTTASTENIAKQAGSIGQDAETRTYTIGVILYREDNAYISSVRKALEAEAGNYDNIELITSNSENNQALQETQIKDMIERGVDALAVNIVNIDAAQEVVDIIKSSGIPVVFFNREPSESIIKTYEKARYVGTTALESGIIQGQLIVELWNTNLYDTNTDGVMQYVLLRGEDNHLEAIARSEYSIITIEEAGIKTEALDSRACDWDMGNASATMTEWLEQYGDKIEFIISNNDSMAIGAIKALQAVGYNNGGDMFIPVVGIDATDEAREMIAAGYMSGTVNQGARSMARAIMALALNAAQGNEFLYGTAYIYDSSDIAVRLPYLPYSAETNGSQTSNRADYGQ